MTTTKEHYDNHLAEHYVWMLGDTSNEQDFIRKLLSDHQISASENSYAIDLGAGSGLHSVAIAQMGFHVTSIDFCKTLLDEIDKRKDNLNIKTVCDDISNFKKYVRQPADLIVCGGDTLTHLPDINSVRNLIEECAFSLKENGYIYFSFRDYTNELTGIQRFIPVKSSSNKILTCFLEFSAEKVNVTDIVHYYENNKWKLLASSYVKIRISSTDVVYLLEKAGMKLLHVSKSKGMIHLIAKSEK
ncbi:MAG: class I SAM-dependent methyltransferase [Cytophagales bacterium]